MPWSAISSPPSLRLIRSRSEIFSNSDVPAVPSENDTDAVEVGVKFRSMVPGFITGLRFYKGSLNTGTHTGHLWSRNGTLLSTVTFSNETSSGWQFQALPTPIS